MEAKNVYSAIVYSKLNLSLEITGRRGDLHTLKMLVCPYERYKDEVEFVPESEIGISDIKAITELDGFDESRFLKFFAPKAQRIANKLGIGGRLTVRKGVPLAAGLGGSSAAIAAAAEAMLAFAKESDKNISLDNLFLLELGSDVPCMFYGKPCVVEGVGEIIKPADVKGIADGFSVEIAGGGSDSAECYKLYDKLKRDSQELDTSLYDGNPEQILVDGERISLYKNDLTLPATMINGNIAKLLEEKKNAFKIAFISGSGSAVVFKNYKL